MPNLNISELTKEQLQEESLIDLAYAILNDHKNEMTFEELLTEIQRLTGIAIEELQRKKINFFTDMNIDGRFLVNQESLWGLRSWYKFETIEEETAPTVKTRKKKAKAVLEDEADELEDDLEEFDEDLEEFAEEEPDEDEDLLDYDDEIEEIDPELEEELIEEDEEFLEEEEDLEEDNEDDEEEYKDKE